MDSEKTASGSRYARGEQADGKQNKGTGSSRYARKEQDNRKQEKGTGSSRYARKEQGSSTQEEPNSGSRYVRLEQEKKLREEQERSQKKETLKNQTKKRFRKDPLQMTLLALAGVAIIAYGVVAWYYSQRFYAGTQIWGIDCTKKTVEEVKQEVGEKIGTYTLSIEQRDGISDVITAKQIGLAYDDEGGIEQVLKQQYSVIWPIRMMMDKTSDLQIGTTFDHECIDDVMMQMNGFLPENVVAPRDAYKNETEFGYEVVKEVMGTTLDYEKTREALLNALDLGQEKLSLEKSECYVDPVIYQDDEALNADVNALNEFLGAKITFDFDDRQEVVDASVIKNWIFKDEEGEYYLDEAYIWDYVTDMANKYDTMGCYRVFYSSIGTVEELYDGDYGWLMDQGSTGEYLINAIREKKVETTEPVYYYTGKCRAENDIGDTYVEVCISRQEMWCYQDGMLMVDTPVVTGNPGKGNATPAGGVWAIDAKMQDYVLRGEGYEAPVSYWMPFNGNVGIHDMNRAYFGGTIYLTNGSHGCVNTPYSEAQTIYSIVSIGTPVIVYE